MGIDQISHISIIVENQDEALAWYTEKLGFEKKVDDKNSINGIRWLTVVPPEDQGIEIVLFQAQDERDRKKVGQNPMWVFKTFNCEETTNQLKGKGVTIVKECEDWPWGKSTIFEDLYGNYFNLVEIKDSP